MPLSQTWICTISPRIGETDALGHINNTVPPMWFEKARDPLFHIFMPKLNPQKWNLLVARLEIDFLKEVIYGADVTIKTVVSRVGRSSMDIVQEAFQKDQLCARGKTVMVYCHPNTHKPQKIPLRILDKMRKKGDKHARRNHF